MKERINFLVLFFLSVLVVLSRQWGTYSGYNDDGSGGVYYSRGCYDRVGGYMCKRAKSRGYCQYSWKHKYDYCRRTCGYCRAGYGHQGGIYPGGHQANQCYDKKGTHRCYILKKQGHCHFYNYKYVFCRKSCGACVYKPQPVHGGWTVWGRWAKCKGRCGQGTKERIRYCTNPRPANGGRNCYGNAKETSTCNTGRPCPVNGRWTAWSQWTICKGRCGNGIKHRARSCTNPRPMYGGKNCFGPARQSKRCNTGRPCPVNGGWTDWSQWTVCKGRCGYGIKHRVRSCTNPRPMYGGKICHGPAMETSRCDTGRPCRIDGGWTDWSQWTVCKGRCGYGIKHRVRSCTNPRPMYGGKICFGPAKKTSRCDTGRPCPIDGGWTDWSQWTVCKGPCGLGSKHRVRSCTNPRPMYGGNVCYGFAKEVRSCDTGRPCKVDGGWTVWSTWTECRGRCGQGVKDRVRSCTNPRPKYGGRNCLGRAKETSRCDTGRPCPVDGAWTAWSRWTICEGRCGQGAQHRVRSCTNPRPMNGGRTCSGAAKESRRCATGRPCPVDGGWTAWSRWTGCRGRCGQGSQDRFRTCTQPRPQYGGRDCFGNSRETRRCLTGRPCELRGNWAPWQPWSSCSKVCHQGRQTRSRQCRYPPTDEGSVKIPCSGPGTESRYCNTNVPCKLPGIWTQWNAWSRCTSSCRGGSQSRRRLCEYKTNGGPFEKLPCLGYGHETRECNSNVDCVVDPCQPAPCKLFCQYGFERDRNGCLMCRCRQF